MGFLFGSTSKGNSGADGAAEVKPSDETRPLASSKSFKKVDFSMDAAEEKPSNSVSKENISSNINSNDAVMEELRQYDDTYGTGNDSSLFCEGYMNDLIFYVGVMADDESEQDSNLTSATEGRRSITRAMLKLDIANSIPPEERLEVIKDAETNPSSLVGWQVIDYYDGSVAKFTSSISKF
jgi:hypothetical protein